jgi:pumilio RNA-binding family
MVQQAFDDADEQGRLALASEFVGRVWDALRCPHANYVLQKCIEMIKPQALQFIVDEIRKRTNGAVQAARHRYGCRVIERVLEHCSKEQVAELVEDIMCDAVGLSTHIYGNYVMQHLFEHGDSAVVERLVVVLVQNLHNMCADSYLGAVLDKAITSALTQGCRHTLIAALVADHQRMFVLSCSRWGHNAAKQALLLAETPAKLAACEYLAWYSTRLRSSRYGKSISTLVNEELQASTATA